MSQHEYRCPNCFEESMVQGVCRQCGYQMSMEKSNPMSLPHFYVLAERYLLGRVLGSGGFGITYKAYDLVNQQLCAIKEYVPLGMVIRENGNPTLYVTAEDRVKDVKHGRMRFIEEAEMLSRLNNLPEVVTITDFFFENNTAYFVMEYLEGMTLGQLKNSYGGRIPLSDVLPIICTIGNCLDVVHSKLHVFHRDISPDNIMITRDKKIKLLDFGNAKYLIGRESQTFSVVLKHGYAPPEQYSSKSLQGSFTDVYSLAATFYYVVSGVRLVVAPDRLTGEDYPRLKDMNLGISERISKAVDDALILNSKQRTQTMGDFVRGIWEEPVRSGVGGTEPSVTGLSRKEPARTEPVRSERSRDESSRTGFSRKESSRNESSSSEMPFLRLVGGQPEKIWNITPNVKVGIGRSAKVSEIVPSSSTVISKRHCEIYFDSIEKTFYVMDDSTNGTYVNGRQIKKGVFYRLNMGDQISLGINTCILEPGVTR